MKVLSLLAPLVLGVSSLAAQARPDSVAAIDSARAVPARSSWTSDRRAVRVGDILTIVVDERTVANERAVTNAKSSRDQGGSVELSTSPTGGGLTPKTFGIGYDGRSEQSSKASRSGDLSTVLSVRVTAIEPGGIARIEGKRTVEVDGRKQDIVLSGVVRTEDVNASNTVLSSRIADASIMYKGKTISPKTGIFGKILAILWP